MTISQKLMLQDEDGNEVRAYTYIPEHKQKLISGRVDVTLGLPNHRLHDGRSLNENKDGTFTVVQTGQILKRSS